MLRKTTTLDCPGPSVSLRASTPIEIVPLRRCYLLMIPGTSCLATIVLSLLDKIHSTVEALLKLALMG